MRAELWMDSENGGLDPEVHSPLQFAFLAVKEGEIVDRLNLSLRIDPLVVTTEALQVNKINLADEGIRDIDEARSIYRNFMYKNFFSKTFVTPDGDTRRVGEKVNKENMPFFCGHNTHYDRPFLQKFLGTDFDSCYYHRIDTMMVANCFAQMGLMPGIKNFRLETVAEYLKIPPPERFHDAMCDVEQTFLVWKKLKELVVK